MENSRISLVPTLELLNWTLSDIRSLDSLLGNNLEIEILYSSDCAGLISSKPLAQLNITLLLIANDSRTVGGLGLSLDSSDIFRNTETKELSLFPISLEPEAIISGLLF